MHTADIPQLAATELATLLKSRQISPVEATQAVTVLETLGVHTEDISIPLIAHSAAIYNGIVMPDLAALHHTAMQKQLSDYDHNNQVRLLAGGLIPAQAYQKATRLRHLLRQQILAAFARVDVLVLPTSSSPAPLLPERAGIASVDDVLDAYAGRRSFTAPFNLANVPALSINCGFTAGNLPMGLQIAGKPFAEETVLRVAHAYEQATEWHTRRPPL